MLRVGYLLMASYAQAYISIQVPNTLIDYGKTDIYFRCIVNGTFLESINVIQLKRSNTNIVLISQDGVFWQDNQLQNRSKVDASIENVNSSYLHLKIMACDVNQTIDEEAYQCTLNALGNIKPIIQEDSDTVNLNITGYNKGDQENCGLNVKEPKVKTAPSHAMFVKGSYFTLMKIALILAMSY